MKTNGLILILFCLIGCGDNFNYDLIGSTESFSMISTNVQDEFTIYIYLPPNYNESGDTYPLIIGLDGDEEFETMSGIVSNELELGTIPEVIFVGIGYGSEELNGIKSNRDYTPTVTVGVEDHPTGGAHEFYEFIRAELIPELERKFNIDPSNSKTLMGHSFGGLFTLFASFQERENNPFDKFIHGGSSLWYDSGVIFEYEESYAQAHQDLDVKMYHTMGSLEGGVMIASFDEMNERLIKRADPNLNNQNEFLEKYGHSRSDYITYEKGLNYVFN